MLSTAIDINVVDALVTHIHSQYAATKFKPSNAYQYTVLAAFILQSLPSSSESALSEARPDANRTSSAFKVVSLATGAKCLPKARYPPCGDALHDSHAEVLARRALVRWLYEEVQRATRASESSSGSDWIEQRRTEGKWQLKEDVQLHMYISTVPCGDASMRFLASSQDPTMAALKDSAPPVAPPPGAASRGRDNYSLYGVLRSKPGRADSPPTLCMSCSDKIAVFNVLGVQGALASSIFAPIYINSIIIGDVSGDMNDVVKEDCIRAFYGRLESLKGLPEPYRIARPVIYFTKVGFVYSRTTLQDLYPNRESPPSSSNESLCWFADSLTGSGQEVIVNGLRRGVSPKQRGIEKFRPLLCKLQMFRLHQETRRALNMQTFPPRTTYHSAKQSDRLFQVARAALKGPIGPFSGWLVSGKKWESFDIEGNVLDGEVTQTANE